METYEKLKEIYLKQQVIIDTLAQQLGLEIEPKDYIPRSKGELEGFIEIINPPIISMLMDPFSKIKNLDLSKHNLN